MKKRDVEKWNPKTAGNVNGQKKKILKKPVWSFLIKINNRILYAPRIPKLCIYSVIIGK